MFGYWNRQTNLVYYYERNLKNFFFCLKHQQNIYWLEYISRCLAIRKHKTELSQLTSVLYEAKTQSKEQDVGDSMNIILISTYVYVTKSVNRWSLSGAKWWKAINFIFIELTLNLKLEFIQNSIKTYQNLYKSWWCRVISWIEFKIIKIFATFVWSCISYIYYCEMK